MSGSPIGEGGPEKLVGLDFQCHCGRRHAIGVKHVSVGAGILRDIPRVLRQLGLAGRFTLVYDKNVRPLVQRHLFGILDRPLVYYDAVCFEKEGEVEASVDSAEELISMLPGKMDFLMVMGSGTMNDLAKYAATKLKVPYAVVCSAPSMNGYTSNISALTEQGFKTTQDTAPVAAVFADVNVLKDAPVEMVRAGLGDLLSKNVCNADWRLSHRLKGTYFCEVPQSMTRRQEEYYFEHARDVGERRPEAVRMLSEALLISGFSMAIVGESSPSSGSEHLLSHFWEMQNEIRHRPIQLHGAQVGVGTLIASAIYERIEKLTPGDIDLNRAKSHHKSEAQMRELVDRHYGPLAERTFVKTRTKIVDWSETERMLNHLKSNWDDIWQDVARFLRPRAELERVLTEAGCPTRPSQLAVSRDDLYNAIRYSRLQRDRYTILDLADEAGFLEQWAAELTEEFGG